MGGNMEYWIPGWENKNIWFSQGNEILSYELEKETM